MNRVVATMDIEPKNIVMELFKNSHVFMGVFCNCNRSVSTLAEQFRNHYRDGKGLGIFDFEGFNWLVYYCIGGFKDTVQQVSLHCDSNDW